MIKKVLVMLLSCLSVSAIADKPKTLLLIWTKNESIKVISLEEKPKVTFTSSELIISMNEKKNIFSLNDMLLLTYESVKGNGDVNGDGKVDIVDVNNTINYILGQNPTNFSTDVADINSDGKINYVDIAIMVYLIFRTCPQSPPVHEGIIEDLDDLLGQLFNNYPKTIYYSNFSYHS